MSKPQRMVLQFPPNAQPLLQSIEIQFGSERQTLLIHSDAVVRLVIHTPDADFKYTIDNLEKTLTTESDKPFLL